MYCTVIGLWGRLSGLTPEMEQVLGRWTGRGILWGLWTGDLVVAQVEVGQAGDRAVRRALREKCPAFPLGGCRVRRIQHNRFSSSSALWWACSLPSLPRACGCPVVSSDGQLGADTAGEQPCGGQGLQECLCAHRVHLLGLEHTMFAEQAAQRAHTLLSPPSASNATFARVPVATYTNSSQPFRLGDRSFSRQYAHIYATRLLQMRPFLVSRAQQQWGKCLLPPAGRNLRPGRTGTFVYPLPQAWGELRLSASVSPGAEGVKGRCHYGWPVAGNSGIALA